MTTSLTRLQTFFGHLEGLDLLKVMINDEFAGKIGLVSSFGAGSALLLAMVAKIDKNIPVLFLDTGKHFPETLEYVDDLKNKLGLTNIKILHPRDDLLNNIDKDGTLWQKMPNRCCWLRKVEPLNRALKELDIEALITGRKRYQTKEREDMQFIELNEDGRFRINPLANFTKEDIAKAFIDYDLPQHKLVDKGYLSIGCAPCTLPVKEGGDERSGRWAHTADLPGGEQKSECGIHIDNNAIEKPNWNI